MKRSVIKTENLSKEYIIGARERNGESFREMVMSSFSAPFRRLRKLSGEVPDDERIWALKNINFEINEGEIVGIIGNNGAGKSTLLKIFSRITAPTAGHVRIRGRVASLLEVGTGFHQELTGRENIFLNGAILGMTRSEITRRFDAIVHFAEVEKFLDTPVKRYSSGMYLRLAFAVAAHLDPEIMIVDEVLTVGDVEFQKKCLGQMENIGRQGRTVLFVSHNMMAVRRLCGRAILLSAGEIADDGISANVVERYLSESNPGDDPTAESLQRLLQKLPADPDCKILRIGIFQDGLFTTAPQNGRPIEVSFEYEVRRPARGFHVWFSLNDAEGNVIFESQSCGEDDQIPIVQPGLYRSVATIPSDFLSPRRYELCFEVGIAYVRTCFPGLIRIPINVQPGGRLYRAFPGYVPPGVLSPLIPWRTAPC